MSPSSGRRWKQLAPLKRRSVSTRLQGATPRRQTSYYSPLAHSLLECLSAARSENFSLMSTIFIKTELNPIHFINLNTFLYRDSVLKGDIVFAKNVQKSAYVICSSGAPSGKTTH
jgi:hypothetical protein